MSKIKSEAMRYFENAKELLGKSTIEGDRYEDVNAIKGIFRSAKAFIKQFKDWQYISCALS